MTAGAEPQATPLASVRKAHDDRFYFPSLHRPQRSACRLRVYTEDDMPRVLLLATELADNPGASITNAAENLMGAAWRRFQPTIAGPPLLIEHYGPDSYDDHQRTDSFALVEFAVWTPYTGHGGHVRGPRWSHVPRSFVERLIGEEVG